MALIVEDGTGVADANAYVSVDQADAYFTLRANTVWSALAPEAKEAAIVNATDYIELRWGHRAPGKPFTDTQGLRFPRVLECKPEEAFLPTSLLRACCEYAVVASAGPLVKNVELDETGRLPTRYRDKVGPIEEETYWTTGAGSVQPEYWGIYTVPDAMMQSVLLPATPSGGRVVR